MSFLTYIPDIVLENEYTHRRVQGYFLLWLVLLPVVFFIFISLTWCQKRCFDTQRNNDFCYCSKSHEFMVFKNFILGHQRVYRSSFLDSAPELSEQQNRSEKKDNCVWLLDGPSIENILCSLICVLEEGRNNWRSCMLIHSHSQVIMFHPTFFVRNEHAFFIEPFGVDMGNQAMVIFPNQLQWQCVIRLVDNKKKQPPSAPCRHLL